MRLGINDKDMEKVAKRAQKAGWTITISGGNHLKWLSPDGKTMLVSSRTGSYRAWKNFRADLRRAGFDPR
jgi:hypothetical protein